MKYRLPKTLRGLLVTAAIQILVMFGAYSAGKSTGRDSVSPCPEYYQLIVDQKECKHGQMCQLKWVKIKPACESGVITYTTTTTYKSDSRNWGCLAVEAGGGKNGG